MTAEPGRSGPTGSFEEPAVSPRDDDTGALADRSGSASELEHSRFRRPVGLGRRLLFLPLKLSISAAAIAYLLGTEKLSLSQLQLDPSGWPWIALAGLICLTFMLVSQIRYWILLRSGEVGVGLGKVVRVGLISWFLNASLLGGFGFLSADAVKVAFLIRESDRRTKILSATLLDRTIGFAALLVLAVIAFQIGWNELSHAPAQREVARLLYGAFTVLALAVVLSAVALTKGRTASVTVWLLLGALVALAFYDKLGGAVALAVVILPPLLAGLMAPAFLPDRALHQFVVRRIWLGKSIGSFITALVEYRTKGLALLVAFGISLLVQTLILLVLFFLAKGISLENDPTLWQIWFSAPVANAVTVLPLPASGLGVGEAAFDAMLRLCTAPNGVPLAGGAALYLSFRLIMTVLAMVGLPLFLLERSRGHLGSTGDKARPFANGRRLD